MNIHLVEDEKFINRSVNRFEYYYPKQNLFFINKSRESDDFKHVTRRKEVKGLTLTKRSSYKIISDCISNGDNLFIHYLSPMKALYAVKLKKKYDLKIYWIFYGSDLYKLLNDLKRYKLRDVEEHKSSSSLTKILKRIILSVKFKLNIFKSTLGFFKILDNFCFWNHYDYKLFKSSFHTNASFRFFRYYETDITTKNLITNVKEENIILVNHSASKNGNHLTILNSLKEKDQNEIIKKIIVPLSYGSPKIKEAVLKYGYKKLNYCFFPILDFMPKDEYFNLIQKVSVAFFGHLRQEGGNNIYYLLANGVKIFLRNENNLSKYLREKGYIFFSFEEDFNTLEDLCGLTTDVQKRNRQLVLEEFSQETIDETYRSLLE